MTLKYLIQKEFTQIRRNAFLPKLIVVFPIMIMCVMPWVMNMEVKNIKVTVVDNDRSTLSQQLVHSIEASNYFIFKGQQPTYKAALQEVEHSRADVVMVIPQDYSRDMTLGNQPQVLIAANAVNGTKGAMGSAYLTQIVTTHVNPDVTAMQSRVSSLFLYNKHLNFKLFMIPALFAIVMMLMTGFLPALNIVGEKEAGTIEQINVTPVSKWSFILAKLIPYWIIALFVITVCLLLAWAVYGITSVGPLALIYLRDVVLRGDDAPAVRLVHTDALNALLGLCHDLCQPHVLLYRGSAHGLHPWWRSGQHLASVARPAGHRLHYGHLGRIELQEKLIKHPHFEYLYYLCRKNNNLKKNKRL